MNPYWTGILVGLFTGAVVTLFICAIILIHKKEITENDETFLEKQDNFV